MAWSSCFKYWCRLRGSTAPNAALVIIASEFWKPYRMQFPCRSRWGWGRNFKNNNKNNNNNKVLLPQHIIHGTTTPRSHIHTSYEDLGVVPQCTCLVPWPTCVTGYVSIDPPRPLCQSSPSLSSLKTEAWPRQEKKNHSIYCLTATNWNKIKFWKKLLLTVYQYIFHIHTQYLAKLQSFPKTIQTILQNLILHLTWYGKRSGKAYTYEGGSRFILYNKESIGKN